MFLYPLIQVIPLLEIYSKETKDAKKDCIQKLYSPVFNSKKLGKELNVQ